MLIAHISDLHIARPGEKAYGIAPTAENLACCVDHINQLQPEPDLVLVTGDITYSGLLQEAERAANILAQLHAPFFVLPGNHDVRSNLNIAFGGEACPITDQGFIQYVIEGYPLRLIGIDSTAPGEPGGEICTPRAAWLDARLSEAKEQPTVIFMHHPPLKCGVLETDEDGFVGVDLFGKIIEKYSNIQSILCGHIHLQAHAGWRGTVVSIAPSMGIPLVLDLTLEQPSQFTLDAPGYQLHYWSPDENLISHTIYVRETDGPYLFEDLQETIYLANK
ncbi:MAG: phosphodiesterase [Desulfuromusa sp.]